MPAALAVKIDAEQLARVPAPLRPALQGNERNLLADDDPFTDDCQPFDPDAPGADAVPFPEYPTYLDKSDYLARHVIQWLSDESEYNRRVELLRGLRDKYGAAGATHRAAEYILHHLLEHENRLGRAA